MQPGGDTQDRSRGRATGKSAVGRCKKIEVSASTRSNAQAYHLDDLLALIDHAVHRLFLLTVWAWRSHSPLLMEQMRLTPE